jgi:hypothetical protein
VNCMEAGVYDRLFDMFQHNWVQKDQVLENKMNQVYPKEITQQESVSGYCLELPSMETW